MSREITLKIILAMIIITFLVNPTIGIAHQESSKNQKDASDFSERDTDAGETVRQFPPSRSTNTRGADDWIMFCHDLNHSSTTSAQPPLSRDLLWSFDMNDMPTAVEGDIWSTPIIANNTVFSCSKNYYMVSIDIEPDHYVIDEGDSLNLIFNLTNEGNYVDDFRLSLRGLPADWSAEYPEIIQNVPAGGIPQVNLTLQAGNDGTAKLRLVAISQFNTSVMDCARVTVKAESTDTWLQVNAALLSGGTSVALVGVAASGVVWQRRGSGEEEW